MFKTVKGQQNFENRIKSVGNTTFTLYDAPFTRWTLRQAIKFGYIEFTGNYGIHHRKEYRGTSKLFALLNTQLVVASPTKKVAFTPSEERIFLSTIFPGNTELEDWQIKGLELLDTEERINNKMGKNNELLANLGITPENIQSLLKK
jgi:hypothetical protein